MSKVLGKASINTGTYLVLMQEMTQNDFVTTREN